VNALKLSEQDFFMEDETVEKYDPKAEHGFRTEKTGKKILVVSGLEPEDAYNLKKSLILGIFLH
jgi:hypothetical protein